MEKVGKHFALSNRKRKYSFATQSLRPYMIMHQCWFMDNSMQYVMTPYITTDYINFLMTRYNENQQPVNIKA